MRIEGVLFWVFPHRGECEFREKNILGKSCTTFVIVKIVRNLSRGRSPCQRVNHVKSGVIYFSAIYFSAFIYSRIRYYSYVEPGSNKWYQSLILLVLVCSMVAAVDRPSTSEKIFEIIRACSLSLSMLCGCGS